MVFSALSATCRESGRRRCRRSKGLRCCRVRRRSRPRSECRALFPELARTPGEELVRKLLESPTPVFGIEPAACGPRCAGKQPMRELSRPGPPHPADGSAHFRDERVCHAATQAAREFLQARERDAAAFLASLERRDRRPTYAYTPRE